MYYPLQCLSPPSVASAHGQLFGGPSELAVVGGDANRRSRTRIHLALGQETRQNDFVIAMDVEGVVQPADAGMWVNCIRHFLENDLRLHVLSCSDHPFGLGIIELGSLLQKRLVA